MIAFLIANWKTILGMIGTAALAYLLHALDVDRLEAKERSDLAAQQTQLVQQCNDAKKITEGVSHDYQTKLNDLSSQLDTLKRVQPSRCVVVSTPRPAGKCNATAGAAKPAQQDGVTSDALYALAGEGERYRLQVEACQQFISETWKANNQ